MNKSYPAAQGTYKALRATGRLLKMKSAIIFYFSWSVMKYHNSNKLLGWVGSLRSFYPAAQGAYKALCATGRGCGAPSLLMGNWFMELAWNLNQNKLTKSFGKSRNLFSKRFLAVGDKGRHSNDRDGE